MTDEPRHGEADESEIETSETWIEQLGIICVDRSVQSRQVGLQSVTRCAEWLTLSFLTVASPCSCIAGFYSQHRTIASTYSLPISPTGLGPFQLLFYIGKIALGRRPVADRLGETIVLVGIQEEKEV